MATGSSSSRKRGQLRHCLPPALRRHALGDVHALDEDAGHGAVRVADRLEDEVHITLVGRAPGTTCMSYLAPSAVKASPLAYTWSSSAR
jgi:hypothetical protein